LLSDLYNTRASAACTTHARQAALYSIRTSTVFTADACQANSAKAGTFCTAHALLQCVPFIFVPMLLEKLHVRPQRRYERARPSGSVSAQVA